MPIVKVNGVELHYEEHGSGANVIISAQSHFTPNSYQEMLANEGYRVFTITLRGFGKSTHVFEDLGLKWYEVWANDVKAFAEAFQIDQFVYTGVSHGAGVGWKIARMYPELLQAFISVVGAPHDRRGGEMSEARKKTIESADNSSVKAGERFMVATKDAERVKRQEEIRQFNENKFQNMKREEKLISPRKPFPEAKTNSELADMLREIHVPTLLLCACQDDIISAEISLLAAQSVPGAKAIFYQDQSHVMAREIPKQLVNDVVSYLQHTVQKQIAHLKGSENMAAH